MSARTLPARAAFSRFAIRRNCVRFVRASATAVTLMFALLATSNAQEHWPPGSVGKLEGDEISVEGGSFPLSVPGATVLFVTSGSVVTVHTGTARLTLSTGGRVDITGPAKFTVLESAGSFTLALNFGRVRLQIGDATPIRVFTPFLVATPIAIASEPRDFTIGLDVNDVMCVYAAQGAARLEPQFGGDDTLVPQLGEFTLPGERLPPIPAREGTCRTAPYQPPIAARHQAPPPPESLTAPGTGDSNPPAEVHESSVQSNPQLASPAVQSQSADASGGFELPANANRTPPISPAPNHSTPDPPSVEQPAWTVIMPPLTFSSSTPAPPAEPGPQYALAIPGAPVSRDWVFSGHVEEKPLHPSKERGNAKTVSVNGANSKRKLGFWGKLRRFFAGEQPQPPAQPAGSSNPGF